MVDKRYQIFVSSTYEDLKEERKVVIESILQMKHIPAGMELFMASNDEQFEYIKDIIDNCDYYVLIIAGRYGSINPKTGISYTEQEYNYAVEKNIPILVFLQNDENIPDDKKDNNQDKLKEFREEVSQNRLCKFWNNVNELQAFAIISLNEQFSRNPQSGWVRGNGLDNPELLKQINELRIEKENNELKMKIKEYNPDIKNLALGDEKFLIKGESWNYNTKSYIPFEEELTWNKIFSLVAPFLITPVVYLNFKHYLKTLIAEHTGRSVKDINDDSAQTIKIHLYTANLIKVYSANSTQGGIAEFIELTEKGLQYLKELKSVKTQKESPISAFNLMNSLKNIRT